MTENLTHLLDHPSIEVLPRDPAALAQLQEAMPPATEVFVTFLPQESVLRTVEICVGLRKAGFTPVPHVAARGFPDRAVLDDYLNRARNEAAVDRVLLIAGDIDEPKGPFTCTLDLLKTGLLQKHAIRQVSFAGHPEGHPKVPQATVEQALKDKVDFARVNGINTRVVSQFCFEAAPILDWLERIRALGVDAPVRIGIAGPANATTLIKYAMRCGVGNSLRAVRTQATRLGALFSDAGPDGVVNELLGNAARLAGVQGLHIFPFGGVTKSSAWLKSARQTAAA